MALLGGGLAVSFGGAGVLAIGHWTPGGLIAFETYDWVFGVHATPLVLLMPAVLLLLAELEKDKVAAAKGSAWLVPAAWGALVVEACVLVVRLAAQESLVL